MVFPSGSNSISHRSQDESQTGKRENEAFEFSVQGTGLVVVKWLVVAARQLCRLRLGGVVAIATCGGLTGAVAEAGVVLRPKRTGAKRNLGVMGTSPQKVSVCVCVCLFAS